MYGTLPYIFSQQLYILYRLYIHLYVDQFFALRILMALFCSHWLRIRCGSAPAARPRLSAG